MTGRQEVFNESADKCTLQTCLFAWRKRTVILLKITIDARPLAFIQNSFVARTIIFLALTTQFGAGEKSEEKSDCPQLTAFLEAVNI